MAVPKKKISSARRGARRAHNALKTNSLSTCSNCQESVMPHRVCPKCGWYDGREVVEVEE
ncbi:MAG: 50S ribosomal protein L32 [Magnetococcales bacterium]|nr:50S ribosomal protein L32 [Magnetococcales bacterium]